MDSIEKWSRDIDRIDRKIIFLFENRMDIIRRSAEYKKRHGLKTDKRYDGNVVEKTTTGVCDAEIIEYAEGLLLYLNSAANKYQCYIIKRI